MNFYPSWKIDVEYIFLLFLILKIDIFMLGCLVFVLRNIPVGIDGLKVFIIGSLKCDSYTDFGYTMIIVNI